MTHIPRIGISLGDPGGVGLETAAKALISLSSLNASFTLFCDESLFEGLGSFARAVELVELVSRSSKIAFSGSPVFDGTAPIGRPTPRGSEFALESLDAAIQAAIAGEIDALVTMPLSKEGISALGRRFNGHTEYLRDAVGADFVVMMLASGDFRVVPLTRHIAISDVPKSITHSSLKNTVELLASSLIKFEKIKSPKIAILALNPHAGEGGLFGDEEKIIREAIDELVSKGLDIAGPLVPDTAFLPEHRKNYDAIIGMYHDQVLIPLKALGFRSAVNITLGLPFIRCSPGHGTAFDIAGRGLADPSSTIEAIKLAARWASALSSKSGTVSIS